MKSIIDLEYSDVNPSFSKLGSLSWVDSNVTEIYPPHFELFCGASQEAGVNPK